MSRNAVALKSSVPKKPVQRLRSVPVPLEEAEEPATDDRLRGLKEIAVKLLREVKALEQDKLLCELGSVGGLRGLDIKKGIKLDALVREFEANIISQALLITGGNQAKAARLLGIKANTLHYKVKQYNLL